MQRVDSKNKEILEFHDPCLNCISPTFLRNFLGHHGCFVTPNEPDLDIASSSTSQTNSIFKDHLQRLIEFLSKGLSEENRIDWIQAFNFVIPAVTENIDQDSLEKYFNIRKLVHSKKVLTERKCEIELHHGVVFSGRVEKDPAFQRNLHSLSDVRILLLDCIIDFRISEKLRLESLDELIMQEKEWLR